MKTKYILLFVAILAIGIVVLPETVSMFSGQHNFYDTIPAGNQIPCEKCHADISLELSQPGSVNAVHRSIGCEGCHMTTGVNKGNLTQGTNFHAAALPLCIDCHGAYSQGSGLDARNIYANAEAHTNFVNKSNESLLLKGSNEACIGCHTHTAVNISWTRATTMNLNVNMINNSINISSSGTTTLTTSG